MERGNVLVIGNSGVGKSTLINAVVGEEVAKTGWGTSGTTKELEIYESDKIPFRIIDTIGFEPSFFKQQKAINAVKKWSRNSAKDGKEDNQINVIWFCVDGTSSKLFPETIKSFIKATVMWANVPVIVTITKSYSVMEREQNIKMVTEAFEQNKKVSGNLRKVIPVVAATYVLNDTAYAAPEGIGELIDATNEVMPEGLRGAENDIYSFILSRKRALAHSIVGVATTAGVVVGAVPIPFSDAVLLSPIEVAEINALASVYEIPKDEKAKNFFASIVEVGTVSVVARLTLNALKAIPGVNLAASALNAIIAGTFVAAIGEGTVFAFEQVYLGNRTLEDVDWVKNLIESKFTNELVDKVKVATEKISDTSDEKAVSRVIVSLFDPKDKK